ncbi:unnamed protein product [Allacma fusca]|uniref:RlpA-like protein double-psi beta-barrel domain-containing protein n=1 Tax=Allacma fusca TaxID=39272 RepID=A0A8J2PL55_9HEXA|nr:unnamed protein product [Allacma fusca]
MKSFQVIVFSCIIASSYGAKCVYYGSPSETGEQTATGESFNPMGMTTAALPYLPFGTMLQVTNQRTGGSIVVRVNDRFGAPPSEDTLDLTYGAFGALANHDDGVFPCSYSIL